MPHATESTSSPVSSRIPSMLPYKILSYETAGIAELKPCNIFSDANTALPAAGSPRITKPTRNYSTLPHPTHAAMEVKPPKLEALCHLMTSPPAYLTASQPAQLLNRAVAPLPLVRVGPPLHHSQLACCGTARAEEQHALGCMISTQLPDEIPVAHERKHILASRHEQRVHRIDRALPHPKFLPLILPTRSPLIPPAGRERLLD